MKILVVDDEPLLIKSVLSFGKYQFDMAYNGAEALELLAKEQTVYDLIILDLKMPRMNGWDTLKHIRNTDKNKKTFILLLTGTNRDDSFVHGLDSGADEYWVKPFSPNRLLAYLRAIERRVSNGITETMALSSLMSSLSNRERTVLTLVVQGYQNTQIAEKLCLSTTTVKNHLSNIYRKLGVHSRTQAMALLQKDSQLPLLVSK